jgi:hypothetical protein
VAFADSPVAVPSKVVAVITPVTLTPLGKVGAPVPNLLLMLSALSLDIILDTFLVIYNIKKGGVTLLIFISLFYWCWWSF